MFLHVKPQRVLTFSDRQFDSSRKHKPTFSSTMIFLLSSVFTTVIFLSVITKLFTVTRIAEEVDKSANIWGRYHVHLSMFTKAEIRGVLAGHTVAMVTCCVCKMITTSSLMIGQFFDTTIKASSDKYSGYYKRPIKI